MTSSISFLFQARQLFRRLALGCFATVVISTQAQTAVPPYVFGHLAGTLGGPGKVDGNGTSARFSYATGVAADQAGNVYVTDSSAGTIRKITPNGTVTTIAGMPMVAGSQDGAGSAARFNFPTGPATDASGNLFVADWSNNTIRKVTPAGVVTTIAGSPYGPDHIASNDGVGTAARFWGPSSVAVDGGGNLFVADAGSEKIRKITPDGTVTTLALSGPADLSLNIFGSGPIWPRPWNSSLIYSYPSQISVDHAGNLFCGSYVWQPSSVGNPYFRVLKIDPSGVVSSLPQFSSVTSLTGPTVDKLDRLFVGTPTGLHRMDTTGTVTRVTDTPVADPFVVSGAGLTVTPTGDCIVADFEQILKISPAGNVSVFAGLTATPGSADGTGAAAGFRSPEGLAVDANGTVYVADTGNATIRKISPGGAVTTLAGKAGASGTVDGVGAAARFSRASHIVMDASGNLYVSDGAIRKITSDGTVTTLANTPVTASPDVLAADEAGNLYFALDSYNSTTFVWSSTIKKLTPAGVLTSVATIEGGGVGGLVLDHTGNIYATLNDQILKIDPRGNITTLAGPGANGAGASARFTKLGALAIDRAANIFAVDGNSICRIAPDGTTVTIGGSAANAGCDDGLGGDALFNAPGAVAVDGAGNIYVADTKNHTIRIGAPAGAPVITTQPQSQTVAAGATVQFSVLASGVPAPTYQWYLNGAAFNGATSSTFSFSNARSSDAGDYSVVVTNALGSVTSNKATLTISAAAPPASASGGGGGGATEAWFALMLLSLGGLAVKQRKV